MNWNYFALIILLIISSGITAGLMFFLLCKLHSRELAPAEDKPALIADKTPVDPPVAIAPMGVAKSEFLAKVSHELRTPLTSILGVTEMLEYGVYGPLSREQKEALHLIADSSQQMVRLVNDLLEQSRLERGMLQLDIADFVVEDLVSRLRLGLVQAARTKGLSLTCRVAPDVPVILRGDVLRLYQILHNLADNAIKYTDLGKVSVQIYRSGQDEYVFEVSDTGIGIPKEQQSLIYEPFLRLYPVENHKNNGNGNGNGNGHGNGHGNGNGSVEGYGLGLAIVKQLVSLMNGRIQLESNVGQGSKFVVRLPLESSRVKV